MNMPRPNYERFDAGDTDDPRKLYRTIEDIRNEQADQKQTLKRIEGALIGTIEEPGGMAEKIRHHGGRLDVVEARLKGHDDSRADVDMAIRTAKHAGWVGKTTMGLILGAILSKIAGLWH